MTAPENSEIITAPTVFIVDDDPAICEALCDLIESTSVATRHFSSAEAFLGAWAPDMPGCVVLDVRLPGISGIELQGKLAEAELPIPVIIMTAHGDIPMVCKAMKIGAVKFLNKPFQDQELLRGIDQALALDRAQRDAASLNESVLRRLETLSPIERQVLELVTTGTRNKEIAAQLQLSLVTVKLYCGQVMEKMQANSLPDLVKLCETAKLPRQLKFTPSNSRNLL